MIGAIVTIVGIFASIATVIGGVIALQKWRSSRKEICVGFVMYPIPLLAARFEDGDIEVAFKGEHLDDPYISVLRIENTGRQDIVSTDFDNGQPIEILIPGLKAIMSKDESSLRKGLIPEIKGNEGFSIGPELIKKDEGFSHALLTEGDPRDRLMVREYLTHARVRREFVTFDDRSFKLHKFLRVFALVMIVLTIFFSASLAIFADLDDIVVTKPIIWSYIFILPFYWILLFLTSSIALRYIRLKIRRAGRFVDK